MKLNHFRRLPDSLAIAFSGGVDSAVLLHTALQLKREVTLLYCYHGDSVSEQELEFAEKTAGRHNLPLIVDYPTQAEDPGSPEQEWRRYRMQFFKQFAGTVATGHHLDDAAEWYLMSAIRSDAKIMPYSTGNLIKPLIAIPKSQIREYALHHKIEYIEDPTNQDVDFNSRNRVRHVILPEALKINPGLLTMVKNRITKDNT